uniref:Uncharacterized protein n=1 Tax=Chromera velia CCMP2878 TaxID=1169474 RepID=A0A0G4HRY9_9ALVE|eukprot:Cvel_8167.t1-p1 / transcript=Cvel_8167.t1 / gene=Cvel_8167 / organism=Chromera_velia_CCMP2878 / gene_product=hypothetical protein / transcript_product=hypothetical protein / location=Cvel_scaffold445:17611-24251(-) / protein_length=142 / sequence_SO=supercontig / SO=protein_coding / is_pseudo=false
MRSKTFRLPLVDFPPFSWFYRKSSSGVPSVSALSRSALKSETGGAAGTEASKETVETGVSDFWGGDCELGWEDDAGKLSAGAGRDSGSGAEGEEGEGDNGRGQECYDRWKSDGYDRHAGLDTEESQHLHIGEQTWDGVPLDG